MSEESEKISFASCLRHETKKTFWPYLLFVSKVIDLFAAIAIVGFILISIQDAIERIAKAIFWVVGTIIEAIVVLVLAILDAFWYLVSMIPWWAYMAAGVVLLVVMPPVLYAAGICIQRRYEIDVRRTAMVCVGAYGIPAVIVYVVLAWAIQFDAVMRGINIQVIDAFTASLSVPLAACLVLALGTFLVLGWAISKTANGMYPYQVGSGEFADVGKP